MGVLLVSPPNILLITIDAMRADRLGFERSGRSLTANLTSLAERGRLFTHAVAAGVPTYLSFPVIFGGGMPLDGGKTIGLSRGRPTFVEELKRAGYRTAAIIASNPYLSRHYHYDRGFDVFDDSLSPRPPKPGTRRRGGRSKMLRRVVGDRAADGLHGLKAEFNYLTESFGDGNPAMHRASRGEEITRRALSLVRELEGDEPFFLWLHYMDVHGYFYATWRDRDLVLGASNPLDRAVLRYRRFQYVDRWRQLIVDSQRRGDRRPLEHTEADRTYLTGFYDASILYADRSLEPLLDWARGSERTVTVVTSDHGEAFFEHGKIGHAPFWVHDELIRVPLILSGPGIEPGTAAAPVSHSSLPRSITEIAGVDADFGTAPSLLESAPAAAPVLTETLYGMRAPFPRVRLDEFSFLMTCRTADRKYVWCEESGSEELFDLKADPAESRNVIEEGAYADAAQDLASIVKKRATQASVFEARADLVSRVTRVARAMRAR